MPTLLCAFTLCAALFVAAQEPGISAPEGGPVYRVENGITPPHAIVSPDPVYAEEAQREHVEGTVILWLIIDEHGLPHDIKVARSAGHGLDEKAIEAVRQWRFDPARKDGNPVAVQINIEVKFRLDGKGSKSATGSQINLERSNQLYKSGLTAFRNRDLNTAIRMLKQARDLDPNNSLIWNDLGLALFGDEQYEDAAVALRRAVELNPHHAFAFNNLGRTLFAIGNYEEAEHAFRQQISVSANDQWAHGNLGLLLVNRRRYSEAVPELEKGIVQLPNNAVYHVGLGAAYLGTRQTDKGVAEFDKALALSPTSQTRNSIAFHLADENVQLDRAQQYAESAVAATESELGALTLEHVTTADLRRVRALAYYWDTLGWVKFQKRELAVSEKYINAAWLLSQRGVIAYHLGQVLEAEGKTADAVNAYGMALVADHPEDRARAPLQKLSGGSASMDKKLGEARAQLKSMNEVELTSDAKVGDSECLLALAPGPRVQGVRLLRGSADTDKLRDAVQSANLPVSFPDLIVNSMIRLGKVSCNQSKCVLALVPAQHARLPPGMESAASPERTAARQTVVSGPLTLEAIGMRVVLPSDWVKVTDQQPSFSQGPAVVLSQPGTLAVLILGREHLEASPQLYESVLENALRSKSDELQRLGTEPVTRDHFSGTRLIYAWKKDRIAYRASVELFSRGNEHYRVLCIAPAENFGRHAEQFEKVLSSLQFLEPLSDYDSAQK